MKIGVPKEIKANEHRVGLTPEGVALLVRDGHFVLVQQGAGAGIGFTDPLYAAAGATLVPGPDPIFAEADLVVKVKEPQPAECAQLRPGQVLFTYLHLAADPAQVRALLDSRCIAIAYETVTDPSGHLPLLAPMSMIAGRMSAQVAAHYLQSPTGAGILLSGVPGVRPAKVLVLGGGVAGGQAARVAVGMGAEVCVVDRSASVLAGIDALYDGRVRTRFSTEHAVEEEVPEADVVIGAVLIPGAAAPKLVARRMVSAMRPGSVLVDIAIDQGGCSETSRPTSHDEPTYVDQGVVHYCVTNMPGAVARTSTQALVNVTLPFVRALAGGWEQAVNQNPHLAAGVNIANGRIVHPAVASIFNER
jgi:alanine dehydrogenase